MRGQGAIWAWRWVRRFSASLPTRPVTQRKNWPARKNSRSGDRATALRKMSCDGCRAGYELPSGGEASLLVTFDAPKVTKSARFQQADPGEARASLRYSQSPALGNSPIFDGLKHPSLVPGARCVARRLAVTPGAPIWLRSAPSPLAQPSAAFLRGTQGTRSAAKGKPWGALSFAYFSLGKQRLRRLVALNGHRPARRVSA